MYISKISLVVIVSCIFFCKSILARENIGIKFHNMTLPVLGEYVWDSTDILDARKFSATRKFKDIHDLERYSRITILPANQCEKVCDLTSKKFWRYEKINAIKNKNCNAILWGVRGLRGNNFISFNGVVFDDFVAISVLGDKELWDRWAKTIQDGSCKTVKRDHK